SPTPEAGSRYASTYNAKAEPEDVLGTWTNFRQKDLSGGDGASPIPPLLMAFGYGDGGGGPTREMLENLREMHAFPATPQVRQGAVGEFFKRLEASAGDRLPTWNGELYLEYHRGTYTTQSRNKRANRKSEFLLHDAEFLASLASVLDADYRYPNTTFRDAWRLICLNQFHDIIPGSSINAVYVDSTVQYQQIFDMGSTTRDEALQVIAKQTGGDILIINPTSFIRSDLAFLPLAVPEDIVLTDAGGEIAQTQPTEGGVWIDAGTIHPYSVTVLRVGTGAEKQRANSLTATPTLLENDYVRVELNNDGDIARIYDKQAQREVLAPGPVANQFQAFEDRPKFWDAWDVDIFFDDKLWLADVASEVRVVEAGPLRATLEIHRQILNSAYVQR
ncbi:MAG: alpha-mannosidase, partial [uncultured Chloroflexia bacterium]